MATLDVSNRKVMKTIEVSEPVVTLELSSDEAQTLAEILARVGTSRFTRGGEDTHDSGKRFTRGNHQKNADDLRSLLREAGFVWHSGTVDQENNNYIDSKSGIYFYHEDA